MMKNPIRSVPKDPSDMKPLDVEHFFCIVRAVLILAYFGRLFWHFGYFKMYIIDNYCSIGIFVNKSRKIKFLNHILLVEISGHILAVNNRDLEHGLKNKYMYEVPEVNFLL